MSSIIVPVNASANGSVFSPKAIKPDYNYLVDNINQMYGQADGLSNTLVSQISVPKQETSDNITIEDKNTSVEPIGENPVEPPTPQDIIDIPKPVSSLPAQEETPSIEEAIVTPILETIPQSSISIPVNVKMVSTSNSITITWDLTCETESYDIEADGEIIDNEKRTSYIHTGLGANSAHTYRIRAKNSSSLGEWSDAVTKQTLLSTPTNLIASLTDETVIITWDVISGVNGYEVYRDEKSIGIVHEASFADTDISKDYISYYSIKAYNDAGNVSEMSKQLEVSKVLAEVTTTNMMMSIFPATTINTALVLTEDVIYEELELASGGTLDLNGHKLTVEGNFKQVGGIIYVRGGTLEIGGDYSIANIAGDSYSDGYLVMRDTSDRVIVGGNFLMDSKYDHGTCLTAGVLEVKGNFTQRSSLSYGSSNNFRASVTHKVLLSGSSVQMVSFADYQYSKFNILVISKALDTGYTFNFKPVWNSLMELSDDIEPPTTPTNLVVQAKTATSVSLAWTRSTDNLTVSKYQVLRDGNIVGETASTLFIDTNLSPNTTYSYTVKSHDSNGNASDQSTSVSVITDEGIGDPDKPDWYYLSTTDFEGNLIELYLSDLGGSAGESGNEITAIAKSSSDILWREYALSGDTWIDTQVTYASAPGGGVVTAVSALKQDNEVSA
jgi:hypothetical protein